MPTLTSKALKHGGTASEQQIDAHFGVKLREQRLALGLSQTELADQLGITYQQVQKYEAGGTRISASRLCSLARALRVEMGYFFSTLDHAPEQAPLAPARPQLAKGSRAIADAWGSIRDPSMRQSLLKLVQTCVAAQDDPPRS